MAKFNHMFIGVGNLYNVGTDMTKTDNPIGKKLFDDGSK